MNIRQSIIALSAFGLLGLASAADAHGVRHSRGYGDHYYRDYPAARWHARQHYKARHYRKHRRHFRRHHYRSHRDHYWRGFGFYVDGISVRIYDD